MSRIIDLDDYCVHTKYILSVSKGGGSNGKNFYLTFRFRYNSDNLTITYDNKQERDRDYKKIVNEWKSGYNKYGD